MQDVELRTSGGWGLLHLEGGEEAIGLTIGVGINTSRIPLLVPLKIYKNNPPQKKKKKNTHTHTS